MIWDSLWIFSSTFFSRELEIILIYHVNEFSLSADWSVFALFCKHAIGCKKQSRQTRFERKLWKDYFLSVKRNLQKPLRHKNWKYVFEFILSLLLMQSLFVVDIVPTMRSNRVIWIKYLWAHEIYCKLFKIPMEKMLCVLVLKKSVLASSDESDLKQYKTKWNIIVAMELSKLFCCFESSHLGSVHVWCHEVSKKKVGRTS